MFCPEDFEDYALVEQVTETTDSAGGYTQVWSTRVNIWCKVEPTGGTEQIIAGRLEHTESFVLTTHYNSAIVPTDRVTLDGVTYKITRVENLDRRNIYMRIYIESGRT